jgi:hypothetical protein
MLLSSKIKKALYVTRKENIKTILNNILRRQKITLKTFDTKAFGFQQVEVVDLSKENVLL